jgi:hypothetical protein
MDTSIICAVWYLMTTFVTHLPNEIRNCNMTTQTVCIEAAPELAAVKRHEALYIHRSLGFGKLCHKAQLRK